MKNKLINRLIVVSTLIITISLSVKTNVAEAGPCASRGCKGSEGSCGIEYVVFEIGDFKFTKSCDGTNSKAIQQIQQ